MQVCLGLGFKGLVLYTVDFLFHVKWYIRFSYIILYNITSFAHNHYTDICINPQITILHAYSKVTISLICILTTGVIVSTAGEQRFNWTGLTYQMVSIIAEALRLTLSDKLLKEIKIDALSLL